MALSMKHMAMLICFFGIVSFIFGVVAENKKPAAGTPITVKDAVICKYPSDPTVVLGFLSVVSLLISTAAGYWSIFYPYNKRAVPSAALFRSPAFVIFFSIAWGTAGLAAAFLLWPTITEQLLLSRTVHHNPHYACPTAKTGVLGGGAFLSLDSCLFWLVCLMFTDNARQNYFEEVAESQKVLKHATERLTV